MNISDREIETKTRQWRRGKEMERDLIISRWGWTREIRKDLFRWRRKKRKSKKKSQKEPVGQVDRIKAVNQPVRSCGGRFLFGWWVWGSMDQGSGASPHWWCRCSSRLVADDKRFLLYDMIIAGLNRHACIQAVSTTYVLVVLVFGS